MVLETGMSCECDIGVGVGVDVELELVGDGFIRLSPVYSR
jgi:hypothetical protein